MAETSTRLLSASNCFLSPSHYHKRQWQRIKTKINEREKDRTAIEHVYPTFPLHTISRSQSQQSLFHLFL